MTFLKNILKKGSENIHKGAGIGKNPTKEIKKIHKKEINYENNNTTILKDNNNNSNNLNKIETSELKKIEKYTLLIPKEKNKNPNELSQIKKHPNIVYSYDLQESKNDKSIQIYTKITLTHSKKNDEHIFISTTDINGKNNIQMGYVHKTLVKINAQDFTENVESSYCKTHEHRIDAMLYDDSPFKKTIGSDIQAAKNELKNKAIENKNNIFYEHNDQD